LATNRLFLSTFAARYWAELALFRAISFEDLDLPLRATRYARYAFPLPADRLLLLIGTGAALKNISGIRRHALALATNRLLLGAATAANRSNDTGSLTIGHLLNRADAAG
jgi:hypothetical protein